jgi:hypothetical protein
VPESCLKKTMMWMMMMMMMVHDDGGCGDIRHTIIVGTAYDYSMILNATFSFQRAFC